FGVEFVNLSIQITFYGIGQNLSLSLQFVLRIGQTLLFSLEVLLPLVDFGHEPFLSFLALGVFNDGLLKIHNCYSAGSRCACCTVSLLRTSCSRRCRWR